MFEVAGEQRVITAMTEGNSGVERVAGA